MRPPMVTSPDDNSATALAPEKRTIAEAVMTRPAKPKMPTSGPPGCEAVRNQTPLITPAPAGRL
jgi:hypothetical protein